MAWALPRRWRWCDEPSRDCALGHRANRRPVRSLTRGGHDARVGRAREILRDDPASVVGARPCCRVVPFTAVPQPALATCPGEAASAGSAAGPARLPCDLPHDLPHDLPCDPAIDRSVADPASRRFHPSCVERPCLARCPEPRLPESQSRKPHRRAAGTVLARWTLEPVRLCPVEPGTRAMRPGGSRRASGTPAPPKGRGEGHRN